ncbi:branched-chain amino acid transporter [Aliidiomarina taiwanensis]|uniref:Branched-chain amino acid transporter n=1 Tax=Aliidiomarina taiwanensis TaxID=946228 RepID=A0A432XAW6_9GAMM|nr:AzlD domain-containing protein [Aliidiomarina taiwanensis]RUO44381.1 branched-chain amino acid transporter [Aliidiomarina taiwanensis]
MLSFDATNINILVLIALMALVTLATRLGGVYIMSLVPLKPRVQRFIQAMSGSVLIAILAPMALAGDAAARFAMLATIVVMLVVKKPLIAISCGVLAAALFRAY